MRIMSSPSDENDVSGDMNLDNRIDDLEAAEVKRAVSVRLDRRFELLEAIVLSVAAVLAAWTGYQSAKWSGVQADRYSEAGAGRVQSTKSATLAGQQVTIDVIAFTQWLQAADNEGLLQRPPQPGHVYVPDPATLSGFLYERFRPEFRVAADAWVATDPRINPAAPTTPFVMPEYRLAASAEAQRLEAQAEAESAAARQANERSDDYVLMTIMFATVLFFAGISSKMDTLRARLLLLSVGSTLLIAAIVIVVSFPKQV